MKIDVKSPEFCPDNCPHADIEVDNIYSGNRVYEQVFKCRNAALCTKLRDVAIKDGAKE